LDELLNNTPVILDEEEEAVEDPLVDAGKIIKLGWVDGVLLKCLINIWGVMFYLRLSWVIGQAGLIEGLLIIGVSNLVNHV
jgi:solute carrier family 12 sodium/potassium/chloride transporter 2